MPLVTSSSFIRVLICGTGAGGHVLAGTMSSQPDVEVRIFTTNIDKARKWCQIMQTDPLVLVERNGIEERVTASANPFMVTGYPEEAARGCDIVVFALPAFLHGQYLIALAPYLEDGCVIVGLPGQPGFEFEVRQVLGGTRRHFPMMNFDSLPWICRIIEFGRKAIVKGTKDQLTGALQGDLARARVTDPHAVLQRLLGQPPKLALSGHLLGITLRSPNASNHPPMMYSRWKDWDGKALDHLPLFYEAIDKQAVDLIRKINDEILAIARHIMAARPDVDLSQVISQYEWEITCYGTRIGDPTNLMTVLRTNPGYAGITHPMVESEPGRYAPDFRHRFLSEDVPFGLVVLRGVAEIAGMPTPCINSVIAWSQQQLRKQYLVGASLIGSDLLSTRCPQRYGLSRIDDLWGTEFSGTAISGRSLTC